MDKTKQARMHPGAFRSCLAPFTDRILDWWYDDMLTATEIQRRLKADGLDVVRTTITRFIKVRERRAAERKRPIAFQKQKMIGERGSAIKTSPANVREKEVTSSHDQSNVEQKIPVVEPEKEKISSLETLEAEELLRHLRETSPQQLWREAHNAQKKV